MREKDFLFADDDLGRTGAAPGLWPVGLRHAGEFAIIKRRGPSQDVACHDNALPAKSRYKNMSFVVHGHSRYRVVLTSGTTAPLKSGHSPI